MTDDYRQGPDLPSYLTLKEWQLVNMFVLRFSADSSGFLDPDLLIGVQVRDRGKDSTIFSPWVEFSVGEKQYAIWRHNGDLYEVNPDGTVGDEPIHKND